MSITAKFYTFSKRENSTKQPTGGASYNILLKDDCSITNPVITLSGPNPRQYNYAYISDFGRYYFVNDWVCNHNGLWTAHMSVDVLATYKPEIGASTEYVLRSASQFDGSIRDDLYPCNTNTDADVELITGLSIFDPNDICYVIGLINNESTNKFGAVEYYVLTSTQISGLMTYLLGEDVSGVNIMGDTDDILQTIVSLGDAISDAVARNLVNPTQYIVESYSLPYTIDTDSTARNLKAGWWTIPVTGYPVTSSLKPKIIAGGVIAIPKHPQASERGNFTNCAPYSEYMLYAGPFGNIPLDTLKINDANFLNISVWGDKFGNCYLIIRDNNDGIVLDKVVANVKCNFPLGQITMDALAGGQNALTSFVQSSAAAAEGNPYGAAMTAFNGIVNGIKGSMGQVSRAGTSGNFLQCFDNFELVATFHEIVDDDNTHRGRPLCKPVQISTLSGYILVSDADLEISGTYEENQKVKGYMNSGFYYE